MSSTRDTLTHARTNFKRLVYGSFGPGDVIQAAMRNAMAPMTTNMQAAAAVIKIAFILELNLSPSERLSKRASQRRSFAFTGAG